MEVFAEGGAVEDEAEVDDPDGEDEDGGGGLLGDELEGGELGGSGVDDGAHADAFELAEAGFYGDDADDECEGDDAEEDGGDGFGSGEHAFLDVDLDDVVPPVWVCFILVYKYGKMF